MTKQHSEPPQKAGIKHISSKRLEDSLKRLDAARIDLEVSTRRFKNHNDQLESKQLTPNLDSVSERFAELNKKVGQ